MTHSWCSFNTASSNRTVLPQPWREREKQSYGRGRDDDVVGGVEKGVASGRLNAVEVVVWNDLPVHGVENIVDSNQACILGSGRR